MLFEKQSDSPTKSTVIESGMFLFNIWKYAKMIPKNAMNMLFLLQKATGGTS